MYSGSMLVIGILSALIKKNNGGGGGQRVTINLLDSAVNMQMQELGYYLNTGKLPKKNQNGIVVIFCKSLPMASTKL